VGVIHGHNAIGLTILLSATSGDIYTFQVDNRLQKKDQLRDQKPPPPIEDPTYDEEQISCEGLVFMVNPLTSPCEAICHKTMCLQDQLVHSGPRGWLACFSGLALASIARSVGPKLH
jgi:hypothetical protein